MEINDLYGFVLTLVLVGIILGVGLLILVKLQTSDAIYTNTAGCNATVKTACPAAYGAIGDTVTEMGTISSDWLGVIVVVVIAAIVIGLVVKSFGGQR